MAEYIFQSTDPTFEIATRAVAELREQRRLRISYSQISGINRVKSSSRRNNLEFGNLYDFSRRVGLCARICMAHSLELNARAWRVGAGVYENHLDDDENFHTDLTWATRDQTLPDLSGRQSKYCSEYDRFYPHYIIEEKLNERQIERSNKYYPSMMYIFLDNFSQIIQINTTIHVVDRGMNYEITHDDGRYKCRIDVTSTFALIKKKGTDRKFMNLLKTLCQAHANYAAHPVDINQNRASIQTDDEASEDSSSDERDERDDQDRASIQTDDLSLIHI